MSGEDPVGARYAEGQQVGAVPTEDSLQGTLASGETHNHIVCVDDLACNIVASCLGIGSEDHVNSSKQLIAWQME